MSEVRNQSPGDVSQNRGITWTEEVSGSSLPTPKSPHVGEEPAGHSYREGAVMSGEQCSPLPPGICPVDSEGIGKDQQRVGLGMKS